MEPVPETREVIEELVAQGDVQIGVTWLQMGRAAKQIVP